MEVDEILYFEKHESSQLYVTLINDSGAVYYCAADEQDQASRE